MPFASIIYYGTPGLETDIFQSYMSCSGYPVRVVTGFPEAPTITTLAASIAVIALEKPGEELVRLARELCARSEGCLQRIFILTDAESLPVAEPQVEIIQRPFRLSEVIKRIQFLSRQD